ncbi:hypothetical protein AADG42_01205 [Ammonicoccus fulvus]|uniref:Uncharacterized protein n=1 Tax=Ammonicoccus fulvus TaxID=3138240 RepID=A0ABZ3FKS4_9ACTN
MSIQRLLRALTINCRSLGRNPRRQSDYSTQSEILESGLISQIAGLTHVTEDALKELKVLRQEQHRLSSVLRFLAEGSLTSFALALILCLGTGYFAFQKLGDAQPPSPYLEKPGSISLVLLEKPPRDDLILTLNYFQFAERTNASLFIKGSDWHMVDVDFAVFFCGNVQKGLTLIGGTGAANAGDSFQTYSRNNGINEETCSATRVHGSGEPPVLLFSWDDGFRESGGILLADLPGFGPAPTSNSSILSTPVWPISESSHIEVTASMPSDFYPFAITPDSNTDLELDPIEQNRSDLTWVHPLSNRTPSRYQAYGSLPLKQAEVQKATFLSGALVGVSGGAGIWALQQLGQLAAVSRRRKEPMDSTEKPEI